MAYLLIMLICVIVFLIKGIKVSKRIDTEDVYVESVAGIVIGIVVGAVLVFCTSIVVNIIAEREQIIASESEIIALKDNTSLSGEFFLGTGSVDGEMKYVYMKKEGNGYRMKTQHANDLLVRQSESAPKVIAYDTTFANDTVRYWFGANNLDTSDDVLVVPPNSIKQNYNVDLE